MPRGIVNEPQPTQSPRVFMNSRLLFENWSCLLEKHNFFFFVRSRQILQRPYNKGILQARSLALRALLFVFQSQRPEDEAPRRRHESEPAPCRQNQAEPEVKPASGEDEESGSGGGNHGRRGRYQPSRGRVCRREGE